MKAMQLIDPTAINIEADSQEARLAKSKCYWQPHITKAHDADLATNTL